MFPELIDPGVPPSRRQLALLLVVAVVAIVLAVRLADRSRAAPPRFRYVQDGAVSEIEVDSYNLERNGCVTFYPAPFAIPVLYVCGVSRVERIR